MWDVQIWIDKDESVSIDTTERGLGGIESCNHYKIIGTLSLSGFSSL
jgi:hypothetical protein